MVLLRPTPVSANAARSICRRSRSGLSTVRSILGQAHATGSAGLDSRLEAWDCNLELGVHSRAHSAHGLRASIFPTNISYLDTTLEMNLGGNELPFKLPAVLNEIGNTPLLLVDQRGIYAKLEGSNPGGSLKDRTLTSIVLNSFAEGHLKPQGDTLVLVTSGSAGVSLVKLQESLSQSRDIDLNLVVVMPAAYAEQQIPAELIAMEAAQTFHGSDALLRDRENSRHAARKNRLDIMLLDGVFMDVLFQARDLARVQGWKTLEQHSDASSMSGHRSTAMELVEALPGLTDVVCATGTGATAAGLRKFLPEHITVHSRPAESGSISGLSNVERYNNFCNTETLNNYTAGTFDPVVAVAHQRELQFAFGVEAGPSSGACFWLARDVMAEHVAQGKTDAKVAFICADGKVTESVQPGSREMQSSTPMGRRGASIMLAPERLLTPPRRGFIRRQSNLSHIPTTLQLREHSSMSPRPPAAEPTSAPTADAARSQQPRAAGPANTHSQMKARHASEPRRWQCAPSNICYIDTTLWAQSHDVLPYELPSAFDGIGNTPLIGLPDHPGIFAKLEGHNPGGSLTGRTLTSLILNNLLDGQLLPQGDTLVLATSGSAGRALAEIHGGLEEMQGVDLNILIAMPKACADQPVAAELMAMQGVETFHGCEDLLHSLSQTTHEDSGSRRQVLLLDAGFREVQFRAGELARHLGWAMPDHHHDVNSIVGHRSTAMELMQIIPGLTDVVCATGSGSTAAGLRKFLPEHVTVQYNSDHLEMRVAEEHQHLLLREHGVMAGPSSGATFWLAKQVMREHLEHGRRDAKVAFICADGKLL